jgi:hypothetical protein
MVTSEAITTAFQWIWLQRLWPGAAGAPDIGSDSSVWAGMIVVSPEFSTATSWSARVSITVPRSVLTRTVGMTS